MSDGQHRAKPQPDHRSGGPHPQRDRRRETPHPSRERKLPHPKNPLPLAGERPAA